MSTAQRDIITPEGIPLRFELASLGDRAGAFLLDSLIIFASIIALVVLLLYTVSGFGVDGLFMAFVLLFSFLARTFYFAFFELYYHGATPAKRMQNIRVIDARGGPLTAQAVFARNVTRELEVFLPLVVLTDPGQIYRGLEGPVAVLAGAWVLVFLFLPMMNKDRLRVGDLIAGTRVVAVPKTTLLEDVSEVRAAQAPRYAFTPEQLGHYGNFELQVLEDILRKRGEVDPDSVRLVCEKIKRRIDWPQEQWKVDPWPFLSEFYAAQRSALERGLLFGKRTEDKTAARRRK